MVKVLGPVFGFWVGFFIVTSTVINGAWINCNVELSLPIISASVPVISSVGLIRGEAARIAKRVTSTLLPVSCRWSIGAPQSFCMRLLDKQSSNRRSFAFAGGRYLYVV